jgi:hypothetical protein
MLMDTMTVKIGSTIGNGKTVSDFGKGELFESNARSLTRPVLTITFRKLIAFKWL